MSSQESNSEVMNSTLTEENRHLLAASPNKLENEDELRIHTNDTSLKSGPAHSMTRQIDSDAPRLPPTAKVAPLVGPWTTHRSLGHITYPVEPTTPSESPQRRNGGGGYIRRHTEVCLNTSSSSKLRGERESPGRESRADRVKSLMSLLSEKSQIIEKQKQTIARLQQECKEKDNQLRMITLPEVPTVCDDSSLSTPVRLDILSRKLDEAYYELDRAKSEGDLTQEKLTEREKHVDQLETNFGELKTKNKSLEEKIVKLESYLGNMPTMEEHFSLKSQVTDLHSQCISLTDRLKERDEKILTQSTELREKESTLNSQVLKLNEIKQENMDLELKCRTSDRRLVELHSDNSQLKMELQKVRSAATELEAKSKQDLRDMRERHRQRFLEATAKLKEQYRSVAKRNRQLELQLLKSSDVMTALNNELKVSQGTVSDLKSSIGDLVKQNQALMEKNYGLNEPLEALKGLTSCSPVSSDGSDDTALLQLNQEVSQCVEEVDSLVSLASSVFEGKDPNMSLLLGVSSGGASTAVAGVSSRSSSTAEGPGDIDIEGKYEHHLNRVQRNRREIERLREVVADHFASKVANECHVQ